jgi:ubiquinone/menaquinone biosynthesis C-methylase UbiE
MGGVQATDELAALCHIGAGQSVLEVGSGTGVAACHLAGKYGCRVMGVDLSEEMCAWARKRAERKALAELAGFRTGDAQDLPFDDSSFDVVLCESVTAFPEDQQGAVREYTRVVKPGGYVGMNECTWVRPAPPDELTSYIRRSMGGAKFHTAGEWQALLENAGLVEIQARTFKVNAFNQRLNEMQGLDSQDRRDRMRGVMDFVKMYLTNPGVRRWAREIMPSRQVVRDLFAYLGYGLYVGRKPPVG